MILILGSSVISASSHGYISLNAKKESGIDYVVIAQHKQKSAKKLDPFRVSINIEANDINQQFVYDGEENGLSGVKIKIIGVITSANKWLFLNDFKTLHIGGDKLIKKALEELENEEEIVCKTGRQIIDEELESSTAVPRVNAKFYFLANEDE